jgi:hypothetical protein
MNNLAFQEGSALSRPTLRLYRDIPDVFDEFAEKPYPSAR